MTTIEPEHLEAIGFVDMYCEDENGEGNGHLAEWELKNLPSHVESLIMSYIAYSWELYILDEEGEHYIDIVTKEDFNYAMEKVNLKIRL